MFQTSVSWNLAALMAGHGSGATATQAKAEGSGPLVSGLAGIREHATRGLQMLDMILSSVVPVFFVMALGYLAGWVRDIDNRHVAGLNALERRMMMATDGRNAHRGASSALGLLVAGGALPESRLKGLRRLHRELMALWASPGDSADLLGVTLFLGRLEVGEPHDHDDHETASPRLLKSRDRV